MKKTVLLMRPNGTEDKKDTYITFPLGLGYIAAILKNDDYDVHVIDLTLEDVNYESLADRINHINPDVIGISALSHLYPQVKKLASFLNKHTKSEIILGGHLAHHSYTPILENTTVDVCVVGEGELTIVNLLENMDNLKSVKGIAYKDNGEVILNTPRELVSDLDSIPFPAYEYFNIEEYSSFDDVYLSKKHVRKGKVHKVMSIEAGRGCPFNCHFCSKMFSKVRKRSVDSIIKEIKFLYDTYDIDTIWFQDELLFSNKKYMFEFCDKIKDLDIGWYGNARIDSVDRELIQKATDNKCLLVAYGVETGSKTILKNMNKRTTPEKIIKTLRASIDIGLPLDMGLILGYPGETQDTVNETIDMLNAVGYPGLKFRYITPYPGSKLYNECIADGTINDEEKYLISLGDGSGPYKFRINFTDFTDTELRNLVSKTSKKVFKNYVLYLLKHPRKLFKYIFQKDVMNPLYIIYNKWKNATNYDKAWEDE